MPTQNPIRLLMVDDEESIRRLAEMELSSPRRQVHTAGDAREALSLIASHFFDVIVVDISLPDANGLELLVKIRESIPDVEVILITAHATVESAIEAMKMGAYDYITKPFTLDHLELVIEKAYQRVCLQRENRRLRHSQGNFREHSMVGYSPVMQEIYYLIDKVAPHDVSVLITGETGTGKEVVAQAIHRRSLRSEQPMIVTNCASMQKELVHSELFGHRKGAFTGAYDSQEGLVALADRGILFLDEIGELSLEVQTFLLRMLETKTYRRLGEKQERHADVRLLFATSRDLVRESEAGHFNEALYHRLNVFQIHLPPLRERREDIPPLVEYFLQKSGLGKVKYRVSEEAMQCLVNYSWPGNVRELRNVIERSVILSENDLITTRVLPYELTGQQADAAATENRLTLRELEKIHIRRMLETCRGNRSQAAQSLGISRKTLYRKLKDYGLEQGV